LEDVEPATPIETAAAVSAINHRDGFVSIESDCGEMNEVAGIWVRLIEALPTTRATPEGGLFLISGQQCEGFLDVEFALQEPGLFVLLNIVGDRRTNNLLGRASGDRHISEAVVVCLITSHLAFASFQDHSEGKIAE
jgi:hypothetical protein